MQSPFGGRDSDLGLALIRDCNGACAFDTLLRYRGGTLAELWRALRTLKALQAEARASAPAPASTVRKPAPGPVGARLAPSPAVGAPDGAARSPNPSLAQAPALTEQPDEPERRKNPCDSDRASNPAELRGEPSPAPVRLPPAPLATPGGPAPCAAPIEPETRGQLAESPPARAGEIAKKGSASLLAGTALVPACRRQA